MYMKQKAKKPYEGFSQWTPHGSPFCVLQVISGQKFAYNFYNIYI
jgi:hypothetical protein